MRLNGCEQSISNKNVIIADTRGLEKWFARIIYIVNTYIEQRQKLGKNFQPAGEAFEANLKENYNYFVRVVSTVFFCSV